MKDRDSLSLPSFAPAERLYKAPEIDWLKAADGSSIACRYWQGKAGQAVILYLHGIEGHSQWFEYTASVLNHGGNTIYAPDRRGSGLNPRDRGHLASYQVLLADIEMVLHKIAAEHKDKPIVLMGHCFGAKAAAVIARNDYKGMDEQFALPLSGLILTCPAIATKVDFDWRHKLKIAAEALSGDRRPLHDWPIPLTADMLTDNAAFLEFIEKDPLRLTEATAQFFFESFKLGLIAERAATHIDLPLLMLQAGNDRIIDNLRVEKWYRKCNAAEKELRLFPDAAHSLDFDPLWFKDYTHLLTEWLAARSTMVAS